MKVFVVVSSLLAIASAAPSLLAPTFYAAAPATTIIAAAPAELTSQYHAQDDFGQYSYGYNGGLSAKAESKSLDGITRGSYSYVDAENKLQHVAYTADSLNGFRVEASNLPVAPVETRTAPEPVQDTPEVAQAKVEHMAAIEEAKVRNAEADKADEAEIVAAAPVAPAIAPITTYTAAVAPAPIAIAPVATATYTPGSAFAYSTSALALKKIEQPLAISTYAAAPAAYEVKAPASFAYSTYAHAAPAATFAAPAATYAAASFPTAYSYGVPAPATYATYGYAAPAPHFYAAAAPAPIAIAARSLPVEVAALPEPVQDTPEVAKAKEEHLQAVAEAKARNLQ